MTLCCVCNERRAATRGRCGRCHIYLWRTGQDRPRDTQRDTTPVACDDPSVLRIPLTRGAFALIDVADGPLVAPYCWYLASAACGLQYAHAKLRGDTRNRATALHRFLLNAPHGMHVDHINGDGLDNRRANIRLVTHAQNHQNRRGATTGSRTGTRNVYLNRHGSYSVQLKLGDRFLFFGNYATVEEATVVAQAARAEHMPYSRDRLNAQAGLIPVRVLPTRGRPRKAATQ